VRHSFSHLLLSATVALLALKSPAPAFAQVTTDTSLPIDSAVTRNGTIYEITGGTLRGSNLFHSLRQLSLTAGETAFFNNAVSVQNIITRITGGSVSNIDGLLRANGSANLLLINPSGIVFGPNARLDVGGSFLASTGNSIRFADGFTFSATPPATNELLTVSAPIGLQYGSTPGQIVVQGPGNNLGLDSINQVDRRNRPVGLQVRPGRTLALLGGGVTLQGGNLTASDGQIILGSLANGTIGLTQLGAGWNVSYDATATLRDIALSQAASGDVGGSRGGRIQVDGRRVRVTDGSSLLASTQGNGTGQGIVINAQESLTIAGISRDAAGRGQFQSSVVTDATTTAQGRSGNITVNTPSLSVLDGGQIVALTFGAANAGDLQIRASQIELLRGSPAAPLGPSSFSSRVFGANSSGSGGSINVQADRLFVADGAFISAGTFGRGNAGSISVNASEMEFLRGSAEFGASGLFAQTQPDSAGNGGNITLVGDRLQVLDGARVEVSTFGAGDTGNLSLAVRQVEIAGASPGGNPAGLVLNVGPQATGNARTLQITAQTIQLESGSAIASDTFGRGNAGSIQIDADAIRLRAGNNTTSISVSVDFSEDADENLIQATGSGGNLAIRANQLQVLNGAQIATATASLGNAGSMEIRANTVELAGFNPIIGTSSGLFASALFGTGAGGSITVNADRLRVRDGARITAGNFPSSGNRRIAGSGPAGSINLNARVVELENRGSVTASTAVQGQGNIAIDAQLLYLNQNSIIATNSEGRDPGGNIVLNTDFVLAQDNSDITANAVNARGGRIFVSALGIFGTAYRESLTPLSDITATSDLGPAFSGTVEITSPDADPIQGLDSLPSSVDRNPQVVAACDRLRGNEMVVTGRGGLPTDATQQVRTAQVWRDTRSLSSPSQANSAATTGLRQTPPETLLVEAQGWTRDELGRVQLLQRSPQTLAQGTAFHSAQCQDL
jgi:filamentous hemagglutinin family protein